jgi:aspartyl-tRNA(Asn)/glutamyl-tRNA(Gln) amidotransferase subunit A
MSQEEVIALPDDPIAGMGLADFARLFRAGRITSEQVTGAYLERIRLLNPALNAYAVINGNALAEAKIADRKRQAGNYTTPLMGPPVAVKQIFSVNGLPCNPATDLDVRSLVPPEGPFIRSLRAAGAIVLGLTRTTEFAAGTINVTKPMPWNPWDANVKRLCGGSSHGSAVSQAAGMSPFAIGSDTGGSVRLPAALCGVVGFKPTQGTISTEGVFPLSPTFDTIGFFANSVSDAFWVSSVFAIVQECASRSVQTLTLGSPAQFIADLDPEVAAAFDRARNHLASAGVRIVPFDLSEAGEVPNVFGRILSTELIAYLGRDRIIGNQAKLDPVVWVRLEPELQTTASELEHLRERHRDLIGVVTAKTKPFDALIGPTTPYSPSAQHDWATADAAIIWNRVSGNCTRPGNLFGMCGISIPIHDSSELPVGLQVLCHPHKEAELLSIAAGIEAQLKTYARPQLAHFVARRPKEAVA